MAGDARIDRDHPFDAIIQSRDSLSNYTLEDLVKEVSGTAFTELVLTRHLDLAGEEDGQPVIREIARVSKPGRRVYSTVDAVPRVANGLGMAILSTPLGVMADHEARERHVGGEVLCTIF